ncbi:MAG: hypothetical protein B7C55_08250 [Actinomycetales bacterium mxb001]|nr:MAG: hypothetical protein B7C55_08250 [Actinomycetales bacterium mxb001]
MPRSYTAAEFKKALKKHAVNATYYEGWDSTTIDPFGVSPSMGIIAHHTANGGARGNNPSVPWQVRNDFWPIRAAHCNIGRDGLVTVLAARGAYHAGAGGPITMKSGTIAKDTGNRYLYGIELESKGTSASTTAKVTDTDGITPEQVESFTRLCVALCELMDIDEKSICRHADWTDGGPKFGGPWLPTRGRKNDTLVPTEFWRKAVRRRRLANRVKRLIGR